MNDLRNLIAIYFRNNKKRVTYLLLRLIYNLIVALDAYTFELEITEYSQVIPFGNFHSHMVDS